MDAGAAAPHDASIRKRPDSRRSLLLEFKGIIRASSLTSRRTVEDNEGKPRTKRGRRVTVHYEMEPEPLQRASSSTSKDKHDEHDEVHELLSTPKPMPQPRPLSATTATPLPKARRPLPDPSPRRSSFGSSRPSTPSDAPASAKPKPKAPIGKGPAPPKPGPVVRSASAPEQQRKTSPSKIPVAVKQNSPPPHTPTKPKGAHISASTIVVEPGSVSKASLPTTPQRRHMSEVGNTTRAAEPIGISPHRPSASVVGSRAPRTNSISNPRPTGGSPVMRPRSLSAGSRSAAIAASSSTLSIQERRERRASTDSSSHAHRPYRATVRLDGIAEFKGEGNEPTEASAINRVTTIDAASTSPTMPTATTTTKGSLGSAASRKHGSFDFERPGWGMVPGSRGPATTLGIGPRTKRDSPRMSTVDETGRIRRTDAGMAGVGAARIYASTSAAAVNRNVRVVPPPTPPELEPSHTGNSASTSASKSNTGHGTSSWGRSTGKRLSAGFSKLANGLGMGNGAGGKSMTSKASTINVAKERQHPKFPFEPPVTTSPVGIHRELSLDSQRDRDRDRKRISTPAPLSSTNSKSGHSHSHSTSSTTSSTHTGVSAGYRSGTKGRSLDLGLGLAWAPTRVREDAVMPESSFGRSLSASRRERRGREVAEEFRHALDEDGFKAFKKYVHRFDNHEIPFDGPAGIVSRVERLLRKARHLKDDERTRLLDSFVKLTLAAA
ncbi:hypothetical protein HMN09_01283000 [Mycena chlorophos]|uniref:Uncharacterized protein n=1 Tax=Mycena chlorophos TaxID=658473 RepID=A0A8H6S2C5_MYCCL|nr:hypothetical protein HMN09_01283000 [Mycena chlorophos]